MRTLRTCAMLVAGTLLSGIALLLANPAEDEALAVLRGAGDLSAKCNAGVQLRRVGSAKSVPVLASLLGDGPLGHAVLHALEGIDCPEAAAALRDALPHATGQLRIGLVDALGRRRDAEAVAVIAPLLTGVDPGLGASAAAALGRIGGADATQTLRAALNAAQEADRALIQEALLRCAAGMRAVGQAEASAALCQELLGKAANPGLRSAFWRELVGADAANRPSLVSDALAGTDPALRQASAGILRELGAEPGVLAACDARWTELAPVCRLALLEAHLRDPGSALPAVLRAAQDESLDVRLAAWEALAVVNDPATVPALAHAAANGEPPERSAARQALARLHGPGPEEALRAMAATAPPAVLAELVAVLGERADPAAAGFLHGFLAHPEADVRMAALEALAQLAAEGSLEPLLAAWSEAAAGPQVAAWSKAVAAVCGGSRDREACTATVTAAMERAEAAGRRALLPALCRLGTEGALRAVATAAEASDEALRKEAVRTLGQWPDAAGIAVLWQLAATASEPVERALARRGFLALSRHENDPGRRLGLLRQALDAPWTAEEKRLALSHIGRLPGTGSLEAVLPLLDDPDLREEAGAATLAVAEALMANEPEAARAAAAKVLAAVPDQALRSRAAALAQPRPEPGPFLCDWQVAGPYSQEGVTGALNVFEIPFPPEEPGTEVRWEPLAPTHMANLAARFPGRTDCAAYLRTRFTVPTGRDALLLLGSDDGVKAWVNGTIMHSNNIDRPAVPDQDLAPVRLQQGENEILLKITQGQGGWQACARLVGMDGKSFADLAGVGAGTAQVQPPAPAPAPVDPQPVPATLPARDRFRKVQLSDRFYAEGAYYGDFNRDGKLDVVAGPFWFAGPDFRDRHEIRPPREFDPKGYSDNFLTFAGDFNGDGWCDVLCVPFPGKEGYWFENPGDRGGHWPRHLVYDMIGNESPIWADVTGDGRLELLFCNEGTLGYAAPNLERPTQPWAFVPVSGQDKRYQKFTHGLGCGDLNGDGRPDVLEGLGWWEQPETPVAGQPWRFHAQRWAEAAAQILVADLDGDGLSDVVTAWHCHRYGLVWYRQQKRPGEGSAWEQHVILTPTPDVADPAFRVSQLHALALVDMNGDGRLDILTGKRFWAHGPTGDAEPDAPAVLLWFEQQRDPAGTPHFVPHLIDDDSGVGTQVAAVDLNGDNRPDVIVANKKGIFLHLSEGAGE